MDRRTRGEPGDHRNFLRGGGVVEAMRIAVAGGTGFLGRPLAAALAADGHDVVVLTRSAHPAPPHPAPRTSALHTSAPRTAIWDPRNGDGPWRAEIDGAGA